MTSTPYILTEHIDLQTHENYLQRIARRVTYLEKKIEEMQLAGQHNEYEKREMHALKYAFNLTLERYLLNASMLSVFADKFKKYSK